MNEYQNTIVNFEKMRDLLSLYEGSFNHRDVKYDKLMKIFSETLRGLNLNHGLTSDIYMHLANDYGDIRILDYLEEALDKGVFTHIKYKFDNSKIWKQDVGINDPLVIWAEIEMDKIKQARERILKRRERYTV